MEYPISHISKDGIVFTVIGGDVFRGGEKNEREENVIWVYSDIYGYEVIPEWELIAYDYQACDENGKVNGS